MAINPTSSYTARYIILIVCVINENSIILLTIIISSVTAKVINKDMKL